MKLIQILLLTILVSCETEHKPPFIITEKKEFNWYFNGSATYKYQDVNGRWNHFVDTANKYNIGDTIK